jgi:hypothetical protein
MSKRRRLHQFRSLRPTFRIASMLPPFLSTIRDAELQLYRL